MKHIRLYETDIALNFLSNFEIVERSRDRGKSLLYLIYRTNLSSKQHHLRPGLERLTGSWVISLQTEEVLHIA